MALQQLRGGQLKLPEDLKRPRRGDKLAQLKPLPPHANFSCSRSARLIKTVSERGASIPGSGCLCTQM